MKLYHVSPTPGITELQPRISTHGKPLVYATENLNFALFFGSRKSNGDFDGIYGIEGGAHFFMRHFRGRLDIDLMASHAMFMRLTQTVLKTARPHLAERL